MCNLLDIIRLTSHHVYTTIFHRFLYLRMRQILVEIHINYQSNISLQTHCAKNKCFENSQNSSRDLFRNTSRHLYWHFSRIYIVSSNYVRNSISVSGVIWSVFVGGFKVRGFLSDSLRVKNHCCNLLRAHPRATFQILPKIPRFKKKTILRNISINFHSHQTVVFQVC